MPPSTDDLRIRSFAPLSTPAELLLELPCTEPMSDNVANARRALHRILHGQDDRLVVVIGPCSIHDPQAALEYAHRLRPLRDSHAAELEIVMRVYFEKPRTTVGWKGLINDPDLDGSFNINKGLRLGRRLLCDINAMGLPAGVEYLDTISPQYISDLVAWGAIGARTTESQVHRELASGLSCPVGFKNGTDGNVKIAVDAVSAASQPHHFLAVTKEGQATVAATAGNPDGHVILRGGKAPNYGAEHVAAACQMLAQAALPPRLMIDASHANSSKRPENQPRVVDDVAAQLEGGERRIVGVMVESHLVGGRQELTPGKPLVYGQSITDACIDWPSSVAVLERLAAAVRAAARAVQLRLNSESGSTGRIDGTGDTALWGELHANALADDRDRSRLDGPRGCGGCSSFLHGDLFRRSHDGDRGQAAAVHVPQPAFVRARRSARRERPAATLGCRVGRRRPTVGAGRDEPNVACRGRGLDHGQPRPRSRRPSAAHAVPASSRRRIRVG